MQNIATKSTGDSLLATEWNQVPDELENSIEDTGQTLSGADLTQVSKAMSIYAAGGAFYTDSGAADAYVLGVVGAKKAPVAYFDGMEISFRAGNANTGASTVNVAGLGVKNIKSGGATPVAGLITTGINKATYNNSTGEFDLTSPGQKVHTKIIEIGDWDMDADTTVNVAHGLDFDKIRGVSVIIRHDTQNETYKIETLPAFADVAGGVGAIGAAFITLRRLVSGFFDLQ